MSDTKPIPDASNLPGISEIPEMSIGSSILPYKMEDAKSMYFGYLVRGFSVREALNLVNRSKAWLSECRNDPKFIEAEAHLDEMRDTLSAEYTKIEFFRNFALVAEKDYRVLRRSLEMELDNDFQPVPMTPADQSYLLKMRTFYTPQQMAIVQAIVKSDKNNLNFAQWVSQNQDILQVSRTDSVTMKRTTTASIPIGGSNAEEE